MNYICVPYIKLFIDGIKEFETKQFDNNAEPQEAPNYITKTPIPKQSTISLEMWDADTPAGVYPIQGKKMDAWILNPYDINGTLKMYLGKYEKSTPRGRLRNRIDFVAEWLPN